MHIDFTNIPSYVDTHFIAMKPNGKGALRFWGMCRDRADAKQTAKEEDNIVIVELDEEDLKLIKERGI